MQQLDNLKAAIEQQDWAAMRRIGHGLSKQERKAEIDFFASIDRAAMERYLGINEHFELRFERYLSISYAAMCVCSDLKSLLKVEGKMELGYQRNKDCTFYAASTPRLS